MVRRIFSNPGRASLLAAGAPEAGPLVLNDESESTDDLCTSHLQYDRLNTRWSILSSFIHLCTTAIDFR